MSSSNQMFRCEQSSQDRTVDDISDDPATRDAIDGMGAMVFTDEEDCGFFGSITQLS